MTDWPEDTMTTLARISPDAIHTTWDRSYTVEPIDYGSRSYIVVPPCECNRFDGKQPGYVYGSNWPWVPCQEHLNSEQRVVVADVLAVVEKRYPEHIAGGIVALDTVPGYDPREPVVAAYWQTGEPIPFYDDGEPRPDPTPHRFVTAHTHDGVRIVSLFDHGTWTDLDLGDVQAGDWVVPLTPIVEGVRVDKHAGQEAEDDLQGPDRGSTPPPLPAIGSAPGDWPEQATR